MICKKGLVTLNYLVWILRFIFLAILMVSIGFVVSKYVNVRVDVSSVESAIFLERLFSSNALMFQDAVTLRIYPGVIDLKKLGTSSNLDAEFGIIKGSRHISGRVRIKEINKNIFVGKRLFDDLEPQIDSIFGGNVHDLEQIFLGKVRSDAGMQNVVVNLKVLQLK